MAYILDTNIIIRYLAEDDAEKVGRVEKLLRTSEKKLLLPDVAVAEIVWVLKSVYKWQRENISKAVWSLLNVNCLKLNKTTISQTLKNYDQYNIGWVDAYLAALVQLNKASGIYSYDTGIDKVSKLKRFEPK